MSSDKHIKQAIKNIDDDRETTRELLDDAMRQLAKDPSQHTSLGVVCPHHCHASKHDPYLRSPCVLSKDLWMKIGVATKCAAALVVGYRADTSTSFGVETRKSTFVLPGYPH